MATTSSRTVQIQYSGDVQSQIIVSALDNLIAYAETEPIVLTVGDTSIGPWEGLGASGITGIVVTGLTIVPPSGNTTLITLKGSTTTDHGTPLHRTDPTSIALDTTFVVLYLNVATQINGVRLIWS